jgi:hypothetical protein
VVDGAVCVVVFGRGGKYRRREHVCSPPNQSAPHGFVKGFMLIGVLCAVVLPLVFFVKIKKGEAVVAAAH